jgi:hypothetical protein
MLIFEKYISNEIGFVEKTIFSMRMLMSKTFRKAFSEYRLADSYLKMLFFCSMAEKEMQSEIPTGFYDSFENKCV